MTITEAITRADELKPGNDFDEGTKIRWLSELDHKIYEEIVKTHEGDGEIEFSGYGEDTAGDVVLLAADAYAELYPTWLCAKIDLHNSEIAKYNNSITEFNALWQAFERWYNRTHMPKTAKIRYY